MIPGPGIFSIYVFIIKGEEKKKLYHHLSRWNLEAKGIF